MEVFHPQGYLCRRGVSAPDFEESRENMKITDAEKKALKGRGYIMTRDGEHFVGRIITEDGVLTSEELMVAAEAAKKFAAEPLP